MPIYEYRCGACGAELESLQKASEAPLTDCPACGKPSLQKKLSAAGFQLKGTGWYATDFKGSSKKAETKPETKTDAKPDAKPDSSTSTETKKTDAKSEAAA